jgi:hypothetical protein
MRDEQQEMQRGRRAALFILAAMTLALVYMMSELKLFEYDPGPPPLPSRQGGTQAWRIVVETPAGEWLGAVNADTLAARLRDAGCRWLLLRLPLWTAGTRRAEYSRIDRQQMAKHIQRLREADLRIILAPVYWNTAALTPRPEGVITREFFLGYGHLMRDAADFAEHCEADALLLDGVFGDATVSAGEWIDLLASLRLKYNGMIEGRFGEGYSPDSYRTLLDGGYYALADTSAITFTEDGSPPFPVYMMMDDPDQYTASRLQPWRLRLDEIRDQEKSIAGLLVAARTSTRPGGIVLSGKAALDLLVSHDGRNSALINTLHSLRLRQLVNDLERSMDARIGEDQP